jgi:hypothetical protein
MNQDIFEMKKKILYILISFSFLFIFGWYSIGSNNLIIIKLKNMFPLELRNNLKSSIFIIPNIIQENKNLNERISKLNSSINAGLNFNDEVFESKINWYGVRKYYLPYNTSFFPDKKKSFIFKNNDFFFIIFNSGKIINFAKNDLDKNKLFFNNFNTNLEYEFIHNERDNFSKILDIKQLKQNLIVSLMKKESSNCYKLTLVLSNFNYLNKFDFKEIYKNKKCFNKKMSLANNIGNITLIDNQILLRLEKKLLLINIPQKKIEFKINMKIDEKILSNNDLIIKYFTKNKKIHFDIVDLKSNTKSLNELIKDINLTYKNKINKKINKIFDIKKISKKEYKIYSLGDDMKNILIFIISKKNTNAILIDEIKIGKAPEIISDVVDLGEENFLLTFIKEPSVGLLSFFKKKNSHSK